MLEIVRPCIAPFNSRLILGDVVEVLNNFNPKDTFDVIIADPPYNIGKDFGNNNDTLPLADYIDWTNQWLSQCLNLLANDGVLYVYGFPEILARVSVQYPIEEQRWLAWHYTNKAVPSARFWQRSHESILCLWKPGFDQPKLEVEQIREPYTNGYKTNIGRKRKATIGRYSKGNQTTTYNDNGGALPRDVIKIPALAGGAGAAERWFMCLDCGGVYPPSEINKHKNILKHPTQKPMKLTERLILSRINGYGRVLIPFAGSGSECLVAERMGLDWTGIEINPNYVDFARKWLFQCIN